MDTFDSGDNSPTTAAVEGFAMSMLGLTADQFAELPATTRGKLMARVRRQLRQEGVFDLDYEDWDRTIATNLSAPFHLTRIAGKTMAGQGTGGSIVNIASIHAQVGDPNVIPHCASKFGLVGLTKATADALREHEIRVNAIAPGAIDPNSLDRRGAGPTQKVTQADIASLAVYLVSDLARAVTGSVIEMYGSTHSVIKI